MEQERLLLTPPGLINTPNFDGKLTEDRIENLGSYDGKRKKRTWTRWISYVSIGASTLALGFACGRLVVREQIVELRATASPMANATTCASTPTRREWRSLSVAERDNYIDAVLCLKAKSSRLGMSNSLYDDFPYIHNQFDADVHFTASFLPWHRYFIYTYHRALADELPYWDWTLDWHTLFSAPVWDVEHGFSGNGAASSEIDTPFPRPHCVSEGRFAHFQVVYASSASSRHCLKRDFGSGEPVDRLLQKIRPSEFEKLLRVDDYYSFLVHAEAGPHLSIPKASMENFSLFTAPNDPVLFLHHAQIDRLWWLWEQYDLAQRRNAYSGSFKSKSEQRADPWNRISIGSLAPTIEVKDLLNTQSGFLCYRY